MSSFTGCTDACPDRAKDFDVTCARREYFDLEPLIDGLGRFFNGGIMPGHFLTAVLINDLRETIARADDVSSVRLMRLIQLLYNHAPAVAWGTPERVHEWRAVVRAKVGR